jgi:hypothetical protein
MDEWRSLWERSSDAPLAHPERADPDRTYTLVAMLKTFREIITKSGKKMAFGEVEDWSGSLEIVVFSDVLERHREKFLVDKVLFLRGKIDVTRNAPSLKVDEFLDPTELTAKSWREVHLRLRQGFGGEESLYDLRDAIFESPGSCQVFFHVPLAAEPATSLLDAADTSAGAATDPADFRVCETDEEASNLLASGEGGALDPSCNEGPPAAVALASPGPPPAEALVRAHAHICCSPSEETLAHLRRIPVVAEAWRD